MSKECKKFRIETHVPSFIIMICLVHNECAGNDLALFHGNEHDKHCNLKKKLNLVA
jgi:hypothetical protein